MEFNRQRPSNAAGPDGISPKVLWMCSSQMCEIFCTTFNLSFQCGVVPGVWKSSCIVPVLKNNKVGSMNDLSPVALISVAFKTCERIVLPQLEEEEERKLYFNNLLHVHQHTSMKYMIYDTVGY